MNNELDKIVELEDKIQALYDRMFDKYYNGNQLNDWQEINFFGGGNALKYKQKIRELLASGHRVKTGYRTSSMIRGHKTYYIFYKP